MTQVAIEKVDGVDTTLPIFDKIAQQLEAVQRRAFDLFEKRGEGPGHDLEDWVRAEHELFGWTAAELVEKDNAYQLQIALPGFEAEDVEVTASPTELFVHASNQEAKKTRKGEVLWTEFGSTEVSRRFAVLNPINVDRVTATLENGLLKINAPETAKPKGVKVPTA